MVELKSFTVHNGRNMNCLRPSGAMMDYVGGSSLHIPSSSFKSLSDLSTSKSSSSSIEGELVDGTLSLKEEVSGSS